MQQWVKIRTTSTALLIVPMVLLIFTNSATIFSIVLALLAAIGCAGIYISIAMEKRRMNAVNQRQMSELISHYRHDWMNDIQLLFGYVSLRKFDKLAASLDTIRAKVLQESGIAKLGIPSLVAFFVTFRLYYNALTLELEMEDELSLAALPIDKEKVSHLVQMTIKVFNSAALPFFEEPNVLSVQFDLGADALVFDLVFQGVYNEEALRNGMRKMLAGYKSQFAMIEEDYTVNQALVTIQLPLTSKR